MMESIQIDKAEYARLVAAETALRIVLGARYSPEEHRMAVLSSVGHVMDKVMEGGDNA